MPDRKYEDSGTQAITGIDRLIHEPARYLVMAYLVGYQDGSRGENKLVILDPAG